ncbi:LysR family transcriptional regulator [Kurthia sibirica]|uniref:LysR family transcriptional regulator n=1 Tax=Kurthia sibirica TaxID=202750 RepID=A0A2U3AKB4_9BACL|nr:LysR family transcriptional regulator [Kurthia sibirica]PWI24944.1 LysR family transcriptional regulator [Kurthia sibirica]GEK33145.1 putative HTH-type transcriptional regulator YybE [Kurthia sibirica]
MDFQQLIYFHTVAKMQHMTQASVLLNISQPALSKAISQLEGEVGAPLFERVGRAIRLNRYGQLFLERTLPITKMMEDAKQEIRDLVTPNSGTVSVGFTHSIGTQLIAKVVKGFHEQYPNMHFEFIQRDSLHLITDLNDGVCDICLIPYTESDFLIEWLELWREEVYVVVPEQHRLAHLKSISLQELAHESIVTIKGGNSLRQIQQQLFDDVGIAPKIVFEGEEFHTVASFVEAGFGVALLPDMTKLDGFKVKRLHVHDVTCERIIGIASIAGRYLPDVTKYFKQFIIDELKKV